MRISNAKIYYQINGAWIQIEPEYLISLDISEIQATGRAPDARKGTFFNKTYDSIDFKIIRGHYSDLDSLYAKDSMYLRIDDGVAITTGKFIVTEKTTIGNTSEIEWDIDESVAITRTPKAAGAVSGVQDVNVNGTSVVDPDTGIAEINLVPYAKKDYVDEIAEEASVEITSLHEEVDTKQNKLTAGRNITIENNVISASDSGSSTTAQLKAVEPARESLSGESTIQQAINIENVTAIKDLTSLIDEEVTRAVSEESRLDGIIDALESNKADRESVIALDNRKQNKLTAGTNITIENDVISATGGSAAVWGSITGKITDQTDLEDRFGAFATMLEEKITHETTERQEADQQFATAIEELGNTKENTLTAGTNIEINRDDPAHPVINCVGGTGGVDKDYVDRMDATTLTTADEHIAVVSQALDTVAANLATETSERKTVDNQIKEDLNTKANDNSVVHVMAVPSSTTLTTEERSKISGGIYMNGTFLGLTNPMFYPSTDAESGIIYGLVAGKNGNNTTFNVYKIDTNNVITINSANRISFTSGGGVSIYNPYIYGTFRAGNLRVQEVATPTADTDATNKLYVDTAITNALGSVETVLETLTTGSGAN